MSENENVTTETTGENLGDVMDTNVSGGTLEFVKANAGAIGILALAGYGAYTGVKKGVAFIKSKIPAKEDKKPTLKERLAAKKAEKQAAKDEKKPKENES